jgi:uncharacterized protein GlcG (DUF336 family)
MSTLFDKARTIVDKAVAKTRVTGCAPLTTAVLHAGGHLKAFGREDGADIIRPQISRDKARGAPSGTGG